MPRGFSFGWNWERFVRGHYSGERMEIPIRHLLDFLGTPDLAGKSFLYVGCDSGIYSLASFGSGAATSETKTFLPRGRCGMG